MFIFSLFFTLYVYADSTNQTQKCKRWIIEETPLEKAILYKYPEQVVLITSLDSNGIPNIMTAGWTMFCSANPPMVAVAIGKQRHSHNAILANKCFGYAMPDKQLEKEVLFCGTHSGRNCNKFLETKLTPLPAKYIKAPLIGECPVNMECKLVNYYDSGSHTIFVGEILNAWCAKTNELPKRLFNLGKGNFDELP